MNSKEVKPDWGHCPVSEGNKVVLWGPQLVLCTFLCVYMCMCACMCVCVHMCLNQRPTSDIIPQVLLALLFEIGPLPSLELTE